MNAANANEASMMAAPVTRREFLNYALLASLGFFFVSLGGATYFFALPRFKPGEFGSQFDLGLVGDIVAPETAPPAHNSKAKIWISNTDRGLLALYDVCVHLGCLYEWRTVSDRFQCPCHGSEYEKDGTYIRGPAPRSLDRMVIHVYDASGKEIARTNAAGDPIPLPPPDARIVVDTGKIIQGRPHA